MIETLWPLYVIAWGTVAGAGVVIAVIVGVTWITLHDAARTWTTG